MLDITKLFQKQASVSNQPATEIKKKVLIIEDEMDISGIYQQILRENGYDVYPATNGEEGLHKITEVYPNLILLDLRMPVMDGKTMLAHLKNDPEYEKFRTIPVIVLTNSGRTDNIRDTLRLGDASDFLIKSNVTPDQIVEVVKKYLS